MTAETLSPLIRVNESGVFLSCHVQPGAKRTAVAGVYGASLKISLAAPPIDGKANKEPDKIGKAGMHAVPSEHVNAPVIEEFKLTLECRVVEMREVGSHVQIDGEIVNVLADEDILDENGGVDIAKLDPILVDPSADTYHRVGECVGKIFHDGLKLK